MLISGSVYGEGFAEEEAELTNSIDNEFIRAKIKYGSRDTGLFNDIQDILISLKVDETYTESEKLEYYRILQLFVRDINTSLYASKRIDERDYRRAARLLPSVFYYKQKGKLYGYLIQNYNETLRVIPYLSDIEEAKTALIYIGLQFPVLFYGNIEELATFPHFSSVLVHLAVYDPVQTVQNMDKNPYIADILNTSTNPVVKKVLDLKKRLGNNTFLLNILDEVIRNSFNDTHEVDFLSNKDFLTQKLLGSALNYEAFGSVSAMNCLTANARWLFNEYMESGENIFYTWSNNELFTMLVMCQNQLEYGDYETIIKYMKRSDRDLIKNNTLEQLPVLKLNTFLRKMHKGDFVKNLSEIMEPDAAATLLTNEIIGEPEKLEPMRMDWFGSIYNYEKEKKEYQAKQGLAIATVFQLNKTQLSLLSWTRNLNKVDSNILSILKSPIGSRFIDYLARYHPQIIANNKDRLKNVTDWKSLVNKLCYYAPNMIKKYMGTDNIISKIVRESNDPYAKIIEDIFDKYKFGSKAYSLIHYIKTNKYTVQQANELGNNELGYLKALLHISTQHSAAGIQSVEDEQNQVSLKYIRNINDHPSASHPHLQAIRDFNSQELYSMMVLGKEEIFQFAFDYFYKFFQASLSNSSFLEFLPTVNHTKYREFCVLLANFNKFQEMWYKNTTEDQRAKFMAKFVHLDFSDIKAVEQASMICEFVNNCQNQEIQSQLQDNIYKEFLAAEVNKDQLAMAIYSLLGSNVGHRAVQHNEWFTAMEVKYNKYTLSYINVDDMKNRQNRIIEVSYFYNDADGIASFNSYINTFRSMPKWFIQDLGSYYYISSLEGNDYDILANKPQFEQAGQAAIREYLLANSLEPTIIVHRGHSYHSQKTIDQMIGSPKLIFMGSCGGYYKISELLVRSPNAQILSTKQVGTMGINDPVLKSIHETFRTNKNIDWPAFWNSHEARLGSNKDFKMYIPPHKNNGMLFVNAFYRVLGL